MSAPPRLSIRELLYPQSVAVIGASDSVEKFGGRVLAYLLKHGYAGRIAPINPGRREVRGIAAFDSIAAACTAAGPIDVAILALPAAQVCATLRDCAAAGVRGAVVITAQFSEIGEEGAARERELQAIAAESGMRLVGPNCLGIINAAHRMALSSSLSLELDAIRRGDIAIASQSGALMATMIVAAMDCAAGISTCVSVGNQADTELCDFFEAFIDDDATRVICLYIEGLKSPARFRALAHRARRVGKPVLVVKAGRSEPGAIAARSHTASLAGSFDAFRAVCDEAGVVIVNDTEGMLQCAAVISRWGVPAVSGIAVFSGSGGGGALAVDRLVETGLTLAALSEATRDGLAPLVPATHNHLPIDLGVVRQTASAAGFEEVFRRVLADPNVGMGLYILTTQPTMTQMATLVAQVGMSCGKPLLFVNVAGSAGAQVSAALQEVCYPMFRTLDEALRVLGALTTLTVFAQRIDHAVVTRAVSLPTLKPGALSESDAKRLLRAAGIAITQEHNVPDLDQALEAANALGYPVVLKIQSPDIVHKSDVGGVRTDIASVEALAGAYREMMQSVRSKHPDARIAGVLIAECVDDGVVELLLGVRNGEQFGPMLVIGAGGLFVEVLKDVATIACPVSPQSIDRALRGLKCWPMIAGIRGRPGADCAAIVETALQLSALAISLGPRLVELEINPLIVRANVSTANGGHGAVAVAVDARGTLA